MAKRVRGSISPEQIQGDLRQGDSSVVLMAQGPFTPGNMVVIDDNGNAADGGPSGAGARTLVRVNTAGISFDWVMVVNDLWPPYEVNGVAL